VTGLDAGPGPHRRRDARGARGTGGAGGALERVRAATAVAHQRLDTGLDVLQRPWDVDVHRRWLSLTWGLLAPLERGLAAWAATDPAALDVGERARADLARADLRELGAGDDELAALVECPDVPVPATRAAALGVCYVLDGSTLGGRLITRAVVAAGVPPRACTSLTGREGAGRRWRDTAAAVDAVDDHAVGEVADAAIATFAAYERWLAPLSRRPATTAGP
jgi:heme oxygenase (biliverdin-IX-beta and delta-forming)